MDKIRIKDTSALGLNRGFEMPRGSIQSIFHNFSDSYVTLKGNVHMQVETALTVNI